MPRTLVVEDDLLVVIDAEGGVLMAKQKPEFRRFVTARLRAALAAERRLARGDAERAFLEAKLYTARFYADHVLTTAPGLRDSIVGGLPPAAALISMR